MRKLYFILFLFSSILLQAQFGYDFQYYSLNKRSLNLGGEYELNSDFLSNSFINRFAQGGYIDKTMKDDQLKRITGINTIGGLLNTNFTAFFGKDSSKYRFIAGVNHRQFFNASITDDVFKFGFYGNKQFVGEDANLGNSQVNNYSYQEFKLGFLIDGPDTTKAIMGMALSYLKGQDFFRLNTNSSSLYTALDASFINLTTNAQLALSDTASRYWYDFNGHGMSAEFFAETPYKSRLGDSKFILSVSNLGFIKWSSNTLNYTADSTFTYSGVYINDIFALKDSTLNSISLDSISQNATNLDRTKSSTNLPVTFLIIHKIRFSKLFEFTTGFRHLFNANYKPYLFTEGTFYFADKFALNTHLGFGGYGKLTGGIGLSGTIKKHLVLRVGSNSIQRLLMPNKSLGQGAYVSISYKF